MPQVPTLNNPVRDAAMSNAKFKDVSSLEAFGGGERVAQGFKAAGNFAQAGAELVEIETKKADQIQLTQAYADAVKAKNDLMYNPKTGAVARKGKDSFGAMDEYLPQFDQRMADIEGRLNERQKGLFSEIKIKQKLDLDGDLQRHIFKESQEYDAETLKYGMDAAREDAIFNYQTPGKVGESITTQKALVLAHAQNNGRSPEWTEMTLKKVESDTHKDVMERMLANGEDMKASIYFKTVKDSLTGDTATALEKSLEEGTLRGNSQRMADGLIMKHGSFTSAMREVKGMELDPKLRDHLQDRLKSEFAIRESEKKNYIDNLERGAYDIVDKTGDLRQIPPNQWTQFDGGTRAALKRYAEEKRGGGSIKTDMETYYNLKELAGNPETRGEFEKLNLMKFKAKLSDSDMKQFITAQTGVKKGETKTLDGWRTDTQIVDQAYNAMGLDKKSKAGKEKYQMFANRVEQEQITMQEKLGRKLNNTEMQEITDKLKIQVITEKGFFFDTKKRLFEVDPNAGQYEVSEVPPKDRAEIEAVLKKYNRPVTESAILELFTKGLNRVSK